MLVKQPYVFILASGPYGTLYIGVTSDLIARIAQDRTGALAVFTKQYAVHHLVRLEQFEDMHSAIGRENRAGPLPAARSRAAYDQGPN